MKKNVLYISYHYPPSNSVGSNRSYSQVSALRALGHQVKVIYAANDETRYVFNDHHIQNLDDLMIDVSDSLGSKIYNKSSYIKYFIIKFLPKKILTFIRNIKLFLFGDEKNWNNDHNFNLALSLLKEFKPDLLISTSGPIENHSFASRFKKLYQSYWIAEYRDSWSFDPMQPAASPSDLSSRLLRAKERRVIQDTDLILSVSPIIHSYYQRYFNKKSYLILSGWLESQVKLPSPRYIQKDTTSKINVLHLGSMLLGKRSPIPIIDLFENNTLLQDAFNIFFIGRDTKLFTSYLAKTSNAKSAISLIPEVDFFQARAEGLNSDLLLLLMMNDPGERYVVTGKIYEYIYLNKPIIIIDSYQSEASKLIEEYSLGYVCKSITQFEALMIKLSKVFKLDQGESLSKNAREKFNVVNAMKTFMIHLNDHA